MFQEFPYTDMHQLNLDWIIKIAKDFLDQYTHIQQLIEDGEQSLEDLTAEGLQQLDEKATAIQDLLDAWYTEHSEDIAEQLASALSDLNDWYTTHEHYLDLTLAENIAAFNDRAAAKADEVIASIPADYTDLSDDVVDIQNLLAKIVANTINLYGNGDVTIPTEEGYITIDLENPLPAGQYTLSACASSTNPSGHIRFRFQGENNYFLQDIPTSGNREVAATLTFTEEVTNVRLQTGNSLSASAGYGGRAWDIQIEAGTVVTPYIGPDKTAIDYINRLASLKMNNVRVDANDQPFTDCNDITPQDTIIFVQSSGIPYISHYPLNVGGYVVTLGYSPVYPAIQLAMPIRVNTANQIMIRNHVSGTWSDWSYLTSEYDVYPSGDTTYDQDWTNISNWLTAHNGKIHLAPGTYYINVLGDLVGNREIVGAGFDTIIRIKDSDEYQYGIRLANGSSIKNLTLMMDNDNYTASDPYVESYVKNGIRVAKLTDTTDVNVIIENVKIMNFSGAGIIVDNTGMAPIDGCHITNCFIENCGIGIKTTTHAEYCTINNCHICNNYYGVENNGGNNYFTSCHVDSNYCGFFMDNESGTLANNTHGGIVGCTINHTGSNAGDAIHMINATSGMAIVGCNIFYGNIYLKDCQAIGIHGCNFGKLDDAGINITIINETNLDKTNMIDNCIFAQMPTFIENHSTNPKNHIICNNNYTRYAQVVSV